jgi:hypothetical protein
MTLLVPTLIAVTGDRGSISNATDVGAADWGFLRPQVAG